MALIKCPECGKEVSGNAKKCVHCGFVLNKIMYPRLIISIILLVSSIITFLQTLYALTTTTADGVLGLGMFLSMVIFGIIGIIFKDKKDFEKTRIISTASGIIGFAYYFLYNGVFKDLKTWAFLLFIYTLVFLFTDLKKQGN